MSTPNLTIWACSGVRLDNRYEHTIFFTDKTEQRKWFSNKRAKTFTAYSYVRRSWPLQVQATMEEARKWSYLYFQYEGKYYYYFINSIEYKNESTVELQLEMDVVQTYMFDNTETQLLDCFVERQHTPTDIIGEHTVAEGLEMGSYTNYHIFDLEDISTMGVLVMSTVSLHTDLTLINDSKGVPKSYARELNGVYSGLGVYAFDSIENLEKQLSNLDRLGMADAVTAIWMYPKSLVTVADYNGINPCKWDDYDFTDKMCARVMDADHDPTTLALYTNYNEKLFEGYANDVKNNKLFTFPYNLLYVTNNQGDKAEYRFEHFTTQDGKYGFEMYGAISPDAGVRIAPVGYNVPGANVNYDEGVTIGNYPPCAWDSDTYKVWLAQNYNQLAHGIDSGVSSAMLGVGLTLAGVVATAGTGGLGALGVAGVMGAIGGGFSSLYSGYNQVKGIMAQKEDAKAQPPQAKGTFSSTVNVASKRQTFTFYYKSLRKESAKQIDDFFTMYGYRLNRIQVPNINARPAFTYVKTVGCKIAGNLCVEDIVKIESIFDKGITFWKDGNKIGDYSQNNKPT